MSFQNKENQLENTRNSIKTAVSPNKEKDFEPEEDYESLKLRMKRKVSEFFRIHKNLTWEKFNDFMDYIDLSQIFSPDDFEVIWKTFKIISDERETIELEEAIKGVNELLSYFYSDSNESKAETNDDNNNSNSKDIAETPLENKKVEKYVLQSNYEIKIENINDDQKNNVNQDLKKPSSEKSIISNSNEFATNNKNTSNKNLNLNYEKLEINRSRQNSVNFTGNNQIYNNPNSNNNSAIRSNIRPTHQRNITKIFREIDIETLKQLRRVFSLLDIRNKEVLYIRELQDILKYKFINLTFEQIIDFIMNLSYDSDSSKFNNLESIRKQGKININFQLYSRAYSAIEQKILNENFEDFQETLNESYEVKETFAEVYDNINQLDFESKDYISVLADIFISLRQRYELDSSDVSANFSSLLNLTNNKIKNANSSQTNLEINEFLKTILTTIENIKSQVYEYFKNFKDKYNDVEIFLKDLNKNNLQACNKISLLKLISENYERNIKSLEEHYRQLFEKYNTTQPIEVNDELEMLMDENAILKDQLESKYDSIESLKNEVREKDENIFNIKMDLEKMKKINSDIENNSNLYKRKYEEMQNDYEKLRNEIYEKILKEEESSISKSSLTSQKNERNASKDFENKKNDLIQQRVFLKEKFLKEETENANKIMEMSYEKLVMYCLDIEKTNGKFNSLFAEKETKIKNLDLEIENLSYLNQENIRKIYILSSENTRLNARLNDILRENEMNKAFRPSIALNNRMSRMSYIRGVSIAPNNSNFNNNNNNTNVFETNKQSKNNNFFAFNKDKINNILQQQNSEISLENNSNKINNKYSFGNNHNEDNNKKNENNADVSRKLQFENSEQNEFLTINSKTNSSSQVIKGKNSLFEVFKGEKEENNQEIYKNEIRLSNLEMDDEETQHKKYKANIINRDSEINENEIDNLNNQLIQQQREFIKSASNFQIKYNSAFDTRITENKYAQNRNSNHDCNPFIIDANAGFTFRNNEKVSFDNKQNIQEQEISKKEKDNNNNLLINNNSNLEQINFPKADISKSHYDNYDNNLTNNQNISTNNNDESSHFFNNTRRPTVVSNNQGIINEFSRISSFNFDKDLPNNDFWETNDIINNAEETINCGDERKFVLDFSGKTKIEEAEQVNQIVDNIDEFQINDNVEDSNVNNTFQAQSYNPFGSESEFNNNDLITKNSSHLNSILSANLQINSNKDKINSNIKDSYNSNILNTTKTSSHSTIDNNISIQSDDRNSKKYNLFENKNSKNKKAEFSKLNTIKDISEKIPEEEDIEEELEKKDQVEPIEKHSIGGITNTTSKPGHNRNATMDLDKEFTQPSQYMSYDFLTLRMNVAIINMLDKYNEGVSSYEMFSENIHFFDDQKKKTKRYLFITCINIYFNFLIILI